MQAGPLAEPEVPSAGETLSTQVQAEEGQEKLV